MEQLIIFLLFLIVIGIVFLLFRGRGRGQDSLLLQQLNQLSQTLDNRLSESTKAIQSQYGQSLKIIQEVTEKLTQLDNTNKQVVGFAEQLRSLENILQNPKQRGVLGEYYLEELLKNVFSPNQYQMQYEFRDGTKADAVIFVRDKLIPIDSKFSLENYNRIIEENDPDKKEQLEKQFKQDVKTRIDETAKYIKPEEKTLEFAFMFIPAEAVYYDLLVNKIGTVKSNTRDLINYAVREKNVHIVSPTSFYAYLQTILQGLRALQIEESAKEIRERVENLQRHLKTYSQFMVSVGKSLGTTVNHYNKASKEFRKVDRDIDKITGSSNEVEVLELEGPEEPQA